MSLLITACIAAMQLILNPQVPMEVAGPVESPNKYDPFKLISSMTPEHDTESRVLAFIGYFKEQFPTNNQETKLFYNNFHPNSTSIIEPFYGKMIDHVEKYEEIYIKNKFSHFSLNYNRNGDYYNISK